jgi:hypothetical protein
MTSLRVFVDLTVQILNPSVGFPQLSEGRRDTVVEYYSTAVTTLLLYPCTTQMHYS